LPPVDTGGAWFPRSRLTLNEVMTILILFHLSGYRCFKWYYREYVCERLAGYFPRMVGYNRFVELMGGYSALPLAAYTRMFRQGKATGVGFADSTPVKVCHNQRISRHKVFKGHAERGKSSTGWFYGFKLRLTINDRGKYLPFFSVPAMLTTGMKAWRTDCAGNYGGKTLRGGGIYIAGIVRTAVPAWNRVGGCP
jgi:hypothetical protein